MTYSSSLFFSLYMQMWGECVLLLFLLVCILGLILLVGGKLIDVESGDDVDGIYFRAQI